jgi:hypothetical protein
MERMEQLIRESLEARAQDVEPTPALWLEVDRRVARRRRFRVLTWSLAGAAAAMLAVFAVPAVIGLFTGPDQLDIAPLDRTPATGVVSSHAVTVDAEGVVSLLDLRTGATVRELAELGHEVADLAVSPTSTPDAVEFAVIGTEGQLSLAGDRGGSSSASYPGAVEGFGWSVVLSPDGGWAASTAPTPEADGATVLLHPFPVTGQEDTDPVEAGMVVDQGSRLVAWTGGTAEEGDRSELWLVTADGRLVQETLEVTDGVPRSLEVGSSELDAVLDAATSFARDGEVGEPFYVLRDVGAGPELVWFAADGRASDHVPLASSLGEVETASLWLDAKQDGALVGDGERMWMIAHDGRGTFAEPAELGEGIARATLLDVDRPGRVPADEPTDEPTAAPTEPDAAQPEAPVVDGAPLPAPIVTVSLRDLVLHGPDGARTLSTLPAEGESTFVSARVRPRSTLDDLTVVALVRAEGMLDLREYRWDGSDLAWDYLPDHLQPGVGDDAEAGPQAHGPVWSPDGEHLAWFEFGTGAAPTLRVIGWDDGPGTGEPASDNASFTVDTRGQLPLIPAEWVASPDGTTELRAVALDSNEGWYSLPVEIQADGAVALAESTFEARSGPGSRILGLASDGVASPRWFVESTFDGAVLHDPLADDEARRSVALPGELLPGDGLVELWVRSIGDGALVGSGNTAVGYYVGPDGSANRLPGEVVDADLVR